MKKVYAINNMVEYLTNVKVGNASMVITFKNGFLTSNGFEPSTFTTSNPAVQYAIENSPKYKSGFIFLKAKYGEEEILMPTPEKEKSDNNDYPEVKNSQEAKNILAAEPYNVPLTEMSNKEAIKNKALELNVTFSNWK